MRTAAEILADRPTALSVLQACPDLAERIAALAVRASQTGQVHNPEGHNQFSHSGERFLVDPSGDRENESVSQSFQKAAKDSEDYDLKLELASRSLPEGTRVGKWTKNLVSDGSGGKVHFWFHDNPKRSPVIRLHKEVGSRVFREALEKAGIAVHASDTSADAALGWDRRHYTQDAVQAASPKFGCLMAMTPELAGLVQTVADQIQPEDLAEDGVETEPHVTVLYGFNLDFDPSRLEPLLKQAGPITLRLGKVERFECPEYDVIKFGVQSPDLVRLNTDLAKTFSDDISPSKWDYNPHVTIAYVKKGACRGLTSPSEGLTLTTTQLLYSLPDKQGRRTFDVVRASTPQTNHAHSVIQDEAQAVYEEGLQKAKDKRSKAALLLLLLSLGTRAYLKAYTALARLENVPLGPNLRREAVRFAKGRRRFLKPFLSALGGPEASLSKTSPDLPADLQRRIQLVAATEAQATYGQAQLRVLQRAGYTTKNWVTVGDDRVRESHVRCEAQRDIPMDQRFANGLLYPGDPAGGPEEVCNCRCWLEGGSKKPQ